MGDDKDHTQHTAFQTTVLYPSFPLYKIPKYPQTEHWEWWAPCFLGARPQINLISLPAHISWILTFEWWEVEVNPVTTFTILAEMEIFETFLARPVAIQLLKLWTPKKLEFFSGISCWKKERAEWSLVLPRGRAYLQEQFWQLHLAGQCGAETMVMGGTPPGAGLLSCAYRSYLLFKPKLHINSSWRLGQENHYNTNPERSY